MRIVITALAALAALYAVSVSWRQNESAAGLDFYIYYVNAQIAARDDVSNIYADEEQARLGEEYYARAVQSGSELRLYDAQRRRRLDSVSSPFLYTALRWVSRDYERALLQYHALVLAAFAAGVLMIARTVGLSWASALFLIAGALLWYRGFEADIRVGNVNSLQLAAIGAALAIGTSTRARWRWAAAAAIIAMLVIFKPNLMYVPLLLIIARALARDWRRLGVELAGGAAGAVAAIVIAAISYGTFNVWLQWIARANEFWNRIPTRMERNVAPALSIFHEYGIWPSYVIAALLLAATCVAIYAGRKRIDEPLVVAAAILVYLLSAPVVWLHYMVLVFVPAIVLMRWRMTGVVAIVALIAIAEEPYETLTRTPAFPVEAWMIGISMVAFYVCVVWKIARGEAGAPPSAVRPLHSSSEFVHSGRTRDDRGRTGMQNEECRIQN